MKSNSLILLVLLVSLPLAALTLAGLRLVEHEQVVVEQNFRRLMRERLQNVNEEVAEYLTQLEQQLTEALSNASLEPQQLRQMTRREPRILQLFVLQHDGQLQHPDPAAPLTENERTFLLQAAKMFTGQDLHDSVLRSEQRRRRSAVDSASPQNGNGQTPQTPAISSNRFSNQAAEPQQDLIKDTYSRTPVRNLKSFAADSGWFLWYWDRGLNLIYWQRRPSGHIVGCALERARWMADLIAELPETVPAIDGAQSGIASRIRLVNSSADVVYQWGQHEPSANATALCELSLPAPLASWRLQCFVPTDKLLAGTGRSARLSLMISLLALAAVVAVLLTLLIREYRRDMRAAEQQVSFVNQVSHELKTPLTNIRMYAEMLEQDLSQLSDDQTDRPRRRLEVILSEGQRLSRLIGNVLTFARQKRSSLQTQPVDVQPDQLIRRIANRFQPALQYLQIETQLDLAVEESLHLDPDFLEQILGNLISNVEKYAANGGMLKVSSRCSGQTLQIDVCDRGPGIPSESRDAVFQPFARICNDLNYAAGTGIGLSIAREMAQQHGGDVALIQCDTGCTFRVTLQSMP